MFLKVVVKTVRQDGREMSKTDGAKWCTYNHQIRVQDKKCGREKYVHQSYLQNCYANSQKVSCVVLIYKTFLIM